MPIPNTGMYFAMFKLSILLSMLLSFLYQNITKTNCLRQDLIYTSPNVLAKMRSMLLWQSLHFTYDTYFGTFLFKANKTLETMPRAVLFQSTQLSVKCHYFLFNVPWSLQLAWLTFKMPVLDEWHWHHITKRYKSKLQWNFTIYIFFFLKHILNASKRCSAYIFFLIYKKLNLNFEIGKKNNK